MPHHYRTRDGSIVSLNCSIGFGVQSITITSAHGPDHHVPGTQASKQATNSQRVAVKGEHELVARGQTALVPGPSAHPRTCYQLLSLTINFELVITHIARPEPVQPSLSPGHASQGTRVGLVGQVRGEQVSPAFISSSLECYVVPQ